MSIGRVESPIDDSTLMQMALAADCSRNRVWAISPKPRGHGLRAVACDLASGSPTRELSIPVPCFPTSASASADVLFVGGECIEGAIDDRVARAPAGSDYADKRIGVRVRYEVVAYEAERWFAAKFDNESFLVRFLTGENRLPPGQTEAPTNWA